MPTKIRALRIKRRLKRQQRAQNIQSLSTSWKTIQQTQSVSSSLIHISIEEKDRNRKAYLQDYRKNHLAKYREYQKRYSISIEEKTRNRKTYLQAYRKNHLAKYREYQTRYKTKKDVTPNICQPNSRGVLNHDNQRLYKCEECRCTFESQGCLKRHLIVHLDLRPFQCHQCDRAFKHNGHLRNHVQFVHTDVQPFFCNECNLTFKRKITMNKHMQFIHNDVQLFQSYHKKIQSIYPTCAQQCELTPKKCMVNLKRLTTAQIFAYTLNPTHYNDNDDNVAAFESKGAFQKEPLPDEYDSEGKPFWIKTKLKNEDVTCTLKQETHCGIEGDIDTALTNEITCTVKQEEHRDITSDIKGYGIDPLNHCSISVFKNEFTCVKFSNEEEYITANIL